MASVTARSSASDHCCHQLWCGWRPRAHQVGDGDRLGRHRRLREQSDGLRDAPGRYPCQLRTVQQDRPAARLQQSAERPQGGGLAAGVGADDHGDLPVGHGEVQLVDDGAVLVREGQGAGGEPAPVLSGSGPSGQGSGSCGASTAATVTADDQPDQIRGADRRREDAHRQFGGLRGAARPADRPPDDPYGTDPAGLLGAAWRGDRRPGRSARPQAVPPPPNCRWASSRRRSAPRI